MLVVFNFINLHHIFSVLSTRPQKQLLSHGEIDGEAFADFQAAFEPRLSLGKNDCNSYAEKVLEALLADKQKVLEERLFSTLDT